jgi:CheY-like chemotaxis protein
MVLSKVFPTRAAALSGRRLDAVEAGLWLLGAVAAAVLAWVLSDRLWVSLAAWVAVIVLAGWRVVTLVGRLQNALAEAEKARTALARALRRAQKMEAIGRLTVGVAHDFNNHLTVISSNVEMIARHLDRSGEDEAQVRLLRHADAATQGVRRAAILTGRLLSLSRQPAEEPETVDIDRLVDGLAELLRRTLGERVSLEVRMSGSPWFAWVDVNHAENALLSLVVNTREQMPDGAVLRIAVSNVRLDAGFVAAHPTVLPGDYIQIAIGVFCGSAEPARWELTDDLTSADLFMALVFVREAGGCLLRSRIEAGGEPGGLALRLLLPRYVQPAVGVGASPRAGRVGSPRVGKARTTILVVEDDAAIRSVCVATLREIGYDVLEAPDAMEAFRLIADQGGIDLLFTDLGLPGGVSGRALAEAAWNVDSGMRVLFTTGYERAELPERARAALLRKPFDPAQLAAKVGEVLAAAAPVERSEAAQG